MKQLQHVSRTLAAVAGAALLTLLLGASPTLSQAQGFGGPPPPFSQQGQGGNGNGMGMMPPPPGGFGMGLMSRKMTAASVPVSDWASTLKLTSTQQTQIAAIQAQARPARRQGFGGRRSSDFGTSDMGMGMGGPGGGSGGGPGGPPPQGGMGGGPGQGGGGGMMEQRDAAASSKIDALLSDGQRARLTGVLRQMDDLRATGLSTSLFEKLNLSADQKARLASLATQSRAQMKSMMADMTSSNGTGDSSGGGSGDMRMAMAGMRSARAKTREAAYAILNSTQLALAKSAASSGNGGGMGGPGGPGGDGMGGPPPMQGGPGGGSSGGSFNSQAAQSFAGNGGGSGSANQDMGAPPDNDSDSGDDGGVDTAPPPPAPGE